MVPDADPTVQIVAGMLAAAGEGRGRGTQTWQSGLTQESFSGRFPAIALLAIRGTLQVLSSPKLPMEPNAKEAKLSHVELGEFYAATRQFDRAQDEFIEVINSTEAAKNLPLDWSRAVHDSLAIAVRVKQNTDMARQVATSVMNTPAAPIFERQDAEQWKASIEDWQTGAPKSRENGSGPVRRDAETDGKSARNAEVPGGSSGDVYYLRASSVAHDLLQMAPNGQYAAKPC